MSSLYTHIQLQLFVLTHYVQYAVSCVFLPSLLPFPSRVRPFYSLFASRSFLSNSSINSGGSNSIGT